MTIENAKLFQPQFQWLTMEYYVFLFYVKGNGWGCNIGQWVNGHGYLGADGWEDNGSATVAMMKIVDTVGVDKLKENGYGVLAEKFNDTDTKIYINWGESSMNIEEIYEKWCDDERMTEEELECLSSFILTKLEQGEELSRPDFDFIFEQWDYDTGNFVEEWDHGWIVYNYIINAPNEKHYMFQSAHHDDYGFMDSIEDQVCPEVELKEVMVKKWVEVKNG